MAPLCASVTLSTTSLTLPMSSMTLPTTSLTLPTTLLILLTNTLRKRHLISIATSTIGMIMPKCITIYNLATMYRYTTSLVDSIGDHPQVASGHSFLFRLSG
ncbi:hypothetical protein DPMN_138681 [Dreissena polymorpha]|uniref:Uncharacterized protein n=1 Tax=Dreissena polymorpha TaxID=45954 RepID=A0A9D4JEX6_DREPO|nr:hypothetical protein DPMN_138681 [Dreissena polymorpha]